MFLGQNFVSWAWVLGLYSGLLLYGVRFFFFFSFSRMMRCVYISRTSIYNTLKHVVRRSVLEPGLNIYIKSNHGVLQATENMRRLSNIDDGDEEPSHMYLLGTSPNHTASIPSSPTYQLQYGNVLLLYSLSCSLQSLRILAVPGYPQYVQALYPSLAKLTQSPSAGTLSPRPGNGGFIMQVNGHISELSSLDSL